MIACTLLTTLALLMPAASHDNTVEWNGVSHIDWLERSPICPIDGESFEISFQTYQYDITSAQVYVDDGTGWVDADWSRSKGVYDVWQATIPSTVASTLSYYIKLVDGSDDDYLNATGMYEDDPAGGGWSLDFTTVSHAPLGGTLTTDGGAVFKVWASNATTANVRGEFNEWGTSDPMTKSGDYFTCKVDVTVEPYDQYKYFFDASVWKPDARGRAQNPSDNDNSFIVEPTTHVWSDQSFNTPPFEEMVLYELHVGTFSGNGDGLGRMGEYRDVVDTHLDHLLYLGVNVVELMPITEFDYHESWGYNPVNNWAPENAYGSPEDLKYMIDVLHQNGIAVILDVVYNHFSPNGNYLWWYDGSQIYFDDPAKETPWGSQAALWKQEVQDYFADNILHWLEEYHVDGFRMDATRYMRDNWIFPEGYPEGWALMQRINDNIDVRKIDAVSIAEELPNDAWITYSTSTGGAGFDSQWHDLFNDDVRQEVFDATSGTSEMWKIRNAIIDTAYPNKTNLVNYVEGHDEADDARLAVVIDSGDSYSVWAKGRSKFAQGLTILAPGIPMFLMGGEWMESIAFGSGSGNRIDWSKATSRSEIVLFFHDVIAARKSNCGFRSDAAYDVHHLNDTDNVIAFTRGDGEELVVVAGLNNSDLNNYRVGFPHHGTWHEILNSQAAVYLGNGSGNGGSIVTDDGWAYDSMPHSAAITVPQMGLLIFRYESPLGRSADISGDGNVDLYDFYLFQQRIGDCGCGMSADLNEDGRVSLEDLAIMVAAFTGPS